MRGDFRRKFLTFRDGVLTPARTNEPELFQEPREAPSAPGRTAYSDDDSPTIVFQRPRFRQQHPTAPSLRVQAEAHAIPTPSSTREPDYDAIPSLRPATVPNFRLPIIDSKPWRVPALATLVFGSVFAVVVAISLPRTGSVLVTAAGPSRTPIETLAIFIDGVKRCDSSPCRVHELEPGGHILRASAPKYLPMADVALKVEAGEENVLNVTLVRAVETTGIQVSADVGGVDLYVDGRHIGALPQIVDKIAPGQHRIRVAGNDLYEPHEQDVMVAAGTLKMVGPIELKRRRAEVLVEPGRYARAAKIFIESNGDRRPVPRLPTRIALPVGAEYTLIAERRGFVTFEHNLVVDKTDQHKSVVIELTRDTEPAVSEDSPPRAVRRPRAVPAAAAPVRRVIVPAASSANSARAAPMLNIVSDPPSFALLDGRPVGKTPRYGVAVEAGPHTVVFVHPEHGRKSHTLSVGPGGATAMVRFE
jgi:serine/threonine-protein kinase